MPGITTYGARLLVARARGAGVTLAVAESLTAGQVSAAIADVPGASDVLRGGAVTYATETKHTLLGVDGELLARRGPVDEQVALQMAHGVARLLGADVGMATTGVAGPGPADGNPAGTVWIAVCGLGVTRARRLVLSGTRPAVRAATTAHILALAAELLGEVKAAGSLQPGRDETRGIGRE